MTVLTTSAALTNTQLESYTVMRLLFSRKDFCMIVSVGVCYTEEAYLEINALATGFTSAYTYHFPTFL